MNSKRWIQNWHADDSVCVATLPSLHAWLSQLLSSCPDFGYFPQLAKTVLEIDPSYVNQATSILIKQLQYLVEAKAQAVC